MGRWIAAFVILIFLVAPIPFVLTSAGQEFLARAGMQIASWIAVPKDAAVLGEQIFDRVRARDFQAVLNTVERKYVTPQGQAQLARLSEVFPNEEPLRVELVGFRFVSGQTYQLTYEYGFLRRWVLASIILVRSGDNILVRGLNAQPTTESLEQLNALTFVGKSQKHYLFAGAAALIWLFSVVSVYICLFTPMARRKWLWVIFAMLGFTSLNLNWTTGQLGYEFLTVIAPPARAGTGSGFYTPWNVQIGLPLGAIVFWLRRRALMVVPVERDDDERPLARVDS
jgi:hypothetical protein